MNPSLKTLRYFIGCPAALALACGLFYPASLSRGADLVSCAANGNGGDFYTRGFYVPNYPGITADTVTLYFSSTVAGFYFLTLAATADAYNGTLLGNDEELVYLDGNANDEVPLTFYPSASRSQGKHCLFCNRHRLRAFVGPLLRHREAGVRT